MRAELPASDTAVGAHDWDAGPICRLCHDNVTPGHGDAHEACREAAGEDAYDNYISERYGDV